MKILPFTPPDMQHLYPLQPHGWQDIGPVFRWYLREQYCFPVKAVLDDNLAGTGVAILLENTGWLAHIIVHPDYRKKGVGSAIVEHLLQLLASKGCVSISLLATDLGFPVYQRFGFEIVTEYIYLETESTQLADTNSPSSIQPYSPEDRFQVLTMINRLYGENRSAVAEPFLSQAQTYKEMDTVRGVFLPTLGEGVIIAADDEAGIELMKRRLHYSSSFYFPRENRTAFSFLTQSGSLEKMRCRRMVHGQPFKWVPQKIYNRISGYLG